MNVIACLERSVGLIKLHLTSNARLGLNACLSNKTPTQLLPQNCIIAQHFHNSRSLRQQLHLSRRPHSKPAIILHHRRTNPESPLRTSWIQTSSATVDLKAAISSAMASAGVLHPRVFLGRLFIRFATSFSHVWLAPFRSVPLGMY